jgi:hypothetical protein
MTLHLLFASASVIDQGCGDLILITGALLPVFVLDGSDHPVRAAFQLFMIMTTLALVWRTTRGAWLILRLPCLALGYCCADLATVFIVAGLSFGTEFHFRLLCPFLALSLALVITVAVFVTRLTIRPRGRAAAPDATPGSPSVNP